MARIFYTLGIWAWFQATWPYILHENYAHKGPPWFFQLFRCLNKYCNLWTQSTQCFSSTDKVLALKNLEQTIELCSSEISKSNTESKYKPNKLKKTKTLALSAKGYLEIKKICTNFILQVKIFETQQYIHKYKAE